MVRKIDVRRVRDRRRTALGTNFPCALDGVTGEKTNKYHRVTEEITELSRGAADEDDDLLNARTT